MVCFDITVFLFSLLIDRMLILTDRTTSLHSLFCEMAQLNNTWKKTHKWKAELNLLHSK